MYECMITSAIWSISASAFSGAPFAPVPHGAHGLGRGLGPSGAGSGAPKRPGGDGLW